MFDLNQRLFNYAINSIIVPRINKVLTMYSVILPATKIGSVSSDDSTIYLQELDAVAISEVDLKD